MQSFSRITSGLLAAQTGLYTTGHNISNSSTPGYSRQRANFSDESYLTLGFNGSGSMKLGLGTKLTSITQLRDEFLDKTYRKAVSKSSFHYAKYDSINEIENILGELYGDARLSKCIEDLWSSFHELIAHPDGMETRSMDLTAANAFLTKCDEISEGLYKYQLTINKEIIRSVNRINEITTQIQDLNTKISTYEGSGYNANDYRDTRNNLIDELAQYGSINVTEDPSGRVTILMEGKDLVSNGSARLLGLRYTAPGYPFVEPIFNANYVKDGRILNDDEEARPLFSNLTNVKLGSAYNNDNGSLKSLLLIRGNAPANYLTDESEVANFTISKFQRELDILFNKIVTLINDIMAPPVDQDDATDAPYNLDGEQFVEFFSRKYVPRYDDDGEFIPEDKTNTNTLYSMGNVVINPKILNDINSLCLSASGDRADPTVLERILSAWNGDYGDYLPSFSKNATKLTFDTYYRQMVTNLGEEGNTSRVLVEAQEKIVKDANDARQQLSGVSLDEELTEMMKFQHAYNGAAKMINIIDTMLNDIINLKR